MMRFSLAACIVLASAWTGFADDNPQPLVITKSGYFLTSVDSGGIPTYQKLSTVIDLTGDGTSQPPEQPPVDKTIVDSSFAWAKAVEDPESAQAIAAVYAHIRGAVDDGTLSGQTVWPPLKQATDSALALIGGKDWTEFRTKLTAVFTEAQQRGQLQTPEQIARMLLSVQHGVELAADGSTAISFERLVEIARRTNTAIDGVAK